VTYKPEDHHVTGARMAGPLVPWACALLALFAMGEQGPPAPARPVVAAAPCGPPDPCALAPSPAQGRGTVVEVHAS
jgi:hypothetical protein